MREQVDKILNAALQRYEDALFRYPPGPLVAGASDKEAARHAVLFCTITTLPTTT